MSPRSFVFSVWVANNKDALKTVAALETIAANNFTVAKEGGRVLVSASMGGKSYSYSLPPDQTAGTVAELAFYAWNQTCDQSLQPEGAKLRCRAAFDSASIPLQRHSDRFAH